MGVLWCRRPGHAPPPPSSPELTDIECRLFARSLDSFRARGCAAALAATREIASIALGCLTETEGGERGLSSFALPQSHTTSFPPSHRSLGRHNALLRYHLELGSGCSLAGTATDRVSRLLSPSPDHGHDSTIQGQPTDEKASLVQRLAAGARPATASFTLPRPPRPLAAAYWVALAVLQLPSTAEGLSSSPTRRRQSSLSPDSDGNTIILTAGESIGVTRRLAALLINGARPYNASRAQRSSSHGNKRQEVS